MARLSMIPKSGNRFPACAKPRHRFVVSFDASAGEGRWEKDHAQTQVLEREDDFE
jgi:hypothetical protein